MSSLTYKDSGVDKEAGYESVRMMKEHVRKTYTPGVISDLGGFSGLFSLAAFKFDEPVLVSGSDGVGTKILIAFMMDIHDTVGEDCVAMSVNDILCQGAKPLFFIDYIATGKLIPEKIAAIVKGVCSGCEKAGAALIGGETAEMPGLYNTNEYDLAGFAVGIVDRNKIIDGTKIKAGDILIGIPSSGLHSNGFSLVRKILFDLNSYDVNTYIPEFGKKLGEELLTPTSIYPKMIEPLLQQNLIKGMSHITGGGFFENIPRMFSDGLRAKIQIQNIQTPAIFDFIQKAGKIDKREMYGTFNMGIGLVVAVAEQDAEKAMNLLKSQSANPIELGIVMSGEKGIDIDL